MAWQSISMDFYDGLPTSGCKNCILVIVDRLSKYSHRVPLAHPFTALTVAKAFVANVYRLHGLPMSIISDRDKVFTSRLWQEFFHLTGVTLQMSSAYHPQYDGQMELVNQCTETFLRCFAMHVHQNGSTGFILPSFGTILHGTLHLATPHCTLWSPSSAFWDL